MTVILVYPFALASTNTPSHPYRSYFFQNALDIIISSLSVCWFGWLCGRCDLSNSDLQSFPSYRAFHRFTLDKLTPYILAAKLCPFLRASLTTDCLFRASCDRMFMRSPPFGTVGFVWPLNYTIPKSGLLFLLVHIIVHYTLFTFSPMFFLSSQHTL